MVKFRLPFDLGLCADESGIHDDATICLVAGYLASIREWLRFDKRWEAILSEFDVADFHSTEFFATDRSGKRRGSYRRWSDRESIGSYGDWTDDRANLFIQRLIEVIQQSRLNPLGSYVPKADFWQLTYGERRFLTGGIFDSDRMKWINGGAPSKPYFLVYDHCVVEGLMMTKPGLRTAFLFDEQRQYESRAVQQCTDSATTLSVRHEEKIGKRFAGVKFHSRLEVPGLQAADLYCHCWYRYVTKPNDNGPRYKALDGLTTKSPGMKFYTLDHLRGLFRHLPAHVHETVRNWPEQKP